MFNLPDLQIHPEQLPSAHPDLTAKYTVPVPSGFMHAYGDVWMRFPRPFPARMSYDFDGTVVSVKEGTRSRYSRSSKGRMRVDIVGAYKVIVRTKYGFSVWGTVGDPSKGPSPLKVGDKVRIKDFVPVPFRNADAKEPAIYRNRGTQTTLHGVITNRSRPAYYRMPLTMDLHMYGIYQSFPGVETIRWSHQEKRWT